ncbi:uncharacterized protein LOC127768356 [Oryza glaberrima]|uniref:Uncharacterized protein n=2 Tax=Oryza TaxID=4527 RepID=A0A0D3FPM0_9ORYZ|nr:uncharacterized protein LOC127768356 [Oryza glaberrima]
MLRQPSSRCHRSKKLLRPKHILQVVLLVAVSVWLVYQLTRNRRRAVAVEGGGAAMDGEVTRRRLGRKGFIVFAGDASDGDGVRRSTGGRSNVATEAEMERGVTSDQVGDGDRGGEGDVETGEEEEEEDDGDGYIADDGLPGDEDDDGGDLRHLQADEMDVISFGPQTNSSDSIAAGPLVNGVADDMNRTAVINTSVNDSGVSLNPPVTGSLRYNHRKATGNIEAPGGLEPTITNDMEED